MSFGFILEAFATLLQGVPKTLSLASLSTLCGAALAVGLTSMQLSRHWPLAWAARAYVFAFRGTPLLVQIFIVYYGFGQFRPFLQDVQLWWFFREPYFCAVFSLSLCTAAYMGEIMRGGVLAVPRGQVEAGKACGMTNWTLFRKIVFPLALRQALPAYANEIVLLVKATSLASIITITEITFLAQKLISETYRSMEVFIAAGSIYLLINFLLTHALGLLEQHLASDRVRPLPAPQAPLEKLDA